MLTRTSILSLLLICQLAVTGQSEKAFLRSANKLYEAGVWSEALPMYLTLLQQAYDKEQNEALVDCYMQLGLYEDAAAWMRMLVDQEPNNPELLRRYADVLKRNGTYHLAKDYYLQFAVYDATGYYLAGTCDYAINNAQADSLVWIESLAVNTPASDISPAFFRKGLLFASNLQQPDKRNKTIADPATGTGFYNLYYAAINSNGDITRATPFDELNSELNDASASFDDVNDVLYIGRNNMFHGRQKAGKDNSVHLSLFYAAYSEGRFKKLEPFVWNDKQYSVGHPCIAGNGKLLLFTSNMEGGYGGTDIYYCTLEEDAWSDPVNLGPVINTAGNEAYPFVTADGRLYFTSDYHPGFGGMDIFWSERVGATWKKPVNPGLPLNSSYDDFACIMTGETGYFSSNRPGGQGSDDLYRITYMKPVQSIHVINSKFQPVAGASVTLLENDHRIEAGYTDGDGNLSLPIESGHAYTVALTKDGYLDAVMYDLEQYRSSNGFITIDMQELYGTDESRQDEDSIIDEQDMDWDTTTTDEEQLPEVGIFDVYIGTFKEPEYTKITSLARFGELSVRSEENGLLSFYILGITLRSTADAALTAALAAGFSEAAIMEKE